VKTPGLFVSGSSLMVLFALGACALQPGTTGTERKPPPARYNLAGYPPAFRDGFDAGCDAAKHNVGTPADNARYGTDPQYRAGWKDGQSLCKPK
jgi:hypothetical protein